MEKECIATLIKTKAMRDEDGVKTCESEEKRDVFVRCASVKQSEFATAGQNGIKPEMQLELYSLEYGGETLVELDGERFIVYRTYMLPEKDTTELYLTKKVGI